MEEAACIDGCSIYQAFFFRVILPLVRPALATIAIFTFLSSWNELMFAMTFISDDRYKTLTVGIQSLAGMYYTEWGPIGAGMVVATFPVLFIYILLSKQVQNAILSRCSERMIEVIILIKEIKRIERGTVTGRNARGTVPLPNKYLKI